MLRAGRWPDAAPAASIAPEQRPALRRVAQLSCRDAPPWCLLNWHTCDATLCDTAREACVKMALNFSREPRDIAAAFVLPAKHIQPHLWRSSTTTRYNQWTWV